jgi:hypothetical protein
MRRSRLALPTSRIQIPSWLHAATRLRVTCPAADGNRYVQRVSIDLDLDAHAVRDATARRVWDGGTATTRIRKDDAGQVAESMRHRNGGLADRDP